MKMTVKSIAPGLVFVCNREPYLKITEGNCDYKFNAVNIVTGEMMCFDPDLIVPLTRFKYSYYIS